MTNDTDKAYEVHYLGLSKNDIVEIKGFNHRFSKKYQVEIIAKIRDRCASLMYAPYIYPVYEHNPTYRKMVVDDYLVFYKVSEKLQRVSIYRILHGRRDIIRIMRQV